MSAAGGSAGGDGEVLFEFQRVGSYLKVIAIDAATGVEVTVAGPATGSLELLKRTAINKLRFVQSKGAGHGKPGPKPGGGNLY
ncbi:hypothetical protein AZL_010050 [Azospirillum sp. B510]|uniref:DUF6898 family protein n=1 Tax=Azospirillum sp. (strain B510) TaxID=137722 RepID=UPI0001C4BD7E|nr:hypothetical protein [Azospirillum sp. B510]BAI71643.1 hypothetical protein AZL_010050 [Azospirillum sp. B510]